MRQQILDFLKNNTPVTASIIARGIGATDGSKLMDTLTDLRREGLVISLRERHLVTWKLAPPSLHLFHMASTGTLVVAHDPEDAYKVFAANMELSVEECRRSYQNDPFVKVEDHEVITILMTHTAKDWVTYYGRSVIGTAE